MVNNVYKNILNIKYKTESSIKKLDHIHIVYIMIILYVAFFSYYTIMRHYTFQTRAYDLGIFLQSFWTTIHEGKLFYTTLWEDSRFENHFSPILFLILPIYAVFQKAETLLILQSFMLGLGALPIYWIARDELNKKAGVIFALLYLLYPALHGVNIYDFHEVALAPTFILFLFYYFKEKNYKMSTIFVVLSLISREDVAMVIVPMAIYWFWNRKGHWSLKDKDTKFSISIASIAMLWFIISTVIVIPSFNTEGYYFVKQYGKEYIFEDLNKKYDYMIDILSPLLFMSLFNIAILIATPIFARNLFANRDTRYDINSQHPALLIPFIFISAIYAVKNISIYISIHTNRTNMYIKNIFSKIIIYSLVVIMILISLSTTPLIRYDMPVITPHDRVLNDIIAMIPDNASIYTQNNLYPHIANRPKAYYVADDKQIFKGWTNPQIDIFVPWKNADFEYILIDDSNRKFSTLRRMDKDSLNILIKDYGIYMAADQIYLFKKGYDGRPNILPSLFYHYEHGLLTSYYNNKNFSGEPKVIDRVANIDLDWREKSPIRGIINRKIFSIKFNGFISIPKSGNYSFEIYADNETQLLIDNDTIIDRNSTVKEIVVDSYESNFIYDSLPIYLEEGKHKIDIFYTGKTGEAYLSLNWLPPWESSTGPITEEYFYLKI